MKKVYKDKTFVSENIWINLRKKTYDFFFVQIA
jgi:hypothetical protein